MSEPTEKSPQMESELQRLFGFDRRTAIRAGRCVPAPVGCGGDATEFRDAQSTIEYTISGLCQACQDKTWPPGGGDFAVRLG